MYYLNTREMDGNGRLNIVTVAARQTEGEIIALFEQYMKDNYDENMYISEMPGASMRNN